MDAQYELDSETGAIKHAALTLYGYYCKLRNGKTGLCFPKAAKTAVALGMPRTNVIMLTNFLLHRGWIHIYETGTIRPLKGFYSDEIRFNTWLKNFVCDGKNALLIRQVCLINRQTCLLIRTLFKGNLNQPIEPAQLTSVSADSPSANSANAPDDKKTDKSQPAGKPTTAAPASPPKPAPRSSAGKPAADNRINHPAVQMVKTITGRYPPKDQWDKIIREIRDEPDIEFFRASWELWRSFDGKPTNLQGWLFQPNERKKLPEIFAANNGNGNGHGKPPPPDWASVGKSTEVFEYDQHGFQIPKPLTEAEHVRQLENFLDLNLSSDELLDYEKFYTAEDWQWLMERLK